MALPTFHAKPGRTPKRLIPIQKLNLAQEACGLVGASPRSGSIEPLIARIEPPARNEMCAGGLSR